MSEKEISEDGSPDQTSALNEPAYHQKAENAEENISLQPLAENDQQQPEIIRPVVSDTSPEAKEQVSTEPGDNVQRETIQQTTEKNMEVHHHPHLHHKKKWIDYLFEFLLLFLAVSAGFFVENKREHYIEHKRANQFSKQLLADLRLDSALFENMNRDIQRHLEGNDKLMYLLTQKPGVTDREILETLLPITYVLTCLPLLLRIIK